MQVYPSIQSDTVIFLPQKKEQKKDSVRWESLPKEYQSIKSSSSRNRWTKRLFSLLFREAAPPDKEISKKALKEDFKEYDGKIIRNIIITVLSPFGTNIHNPDNKSSELNFLNNMHVLTKSSTVRNIIQFKKGDIVRPSIITTSEAELRNANYIYDARIVMQPIESSTDSIDVNIIVRDKWTIGVDLHNLSSRKIDIEVFDKNILGSGSRAGIDFIYSNKYDRKFGYGLNYLYQNIAKTNIDLEGSFKDRIKDYELAFSAEQRLQPKLDYFGEVSYLRRIKRSEITSWDSISPDYRQNISVTFGRAFTISSQDAIKRFVVSLRYKVKSPEYRNGNYYNHIKDILLPYKYVKNKMLLMKLSLYKNSYEKEYMIYNFGNTEDLAQGYNVSLQLGYSKFKHVKDSYYTSLSASYGTNKLLKGYIYLDGAISSFYNKDNFFEGVIKAESRYFSPLFKLSDLRFRQFLTINYSKLLHPDRYFGDRIYMGEHTTLKMKDWRNTRKGFEQLLIKSETDMFLNFEIAGFRFLMYNFLDMGWINETGNLFKNDNFNFGFGTGIRLRNNFIVFNTIDLKIGYYPRLNQSGFHSFFQIKSSTPNVPPNFEPKIPNEIVLE